MTTEPTYEELKNQLLELEQKNELLQSEAIKYRTLFTSFPHGISVSDSHGNIIEANSTSELLLGINKEEQKKRKIAGREWRIIRKDGTDMPPEEWASVIALKENRLIASRGMGIMNSDAQITWISVTAAPLPLEGYGVVITYNDITKQKLAEDALRKSESLHREAQRVAKIGHWELDSLSGTPIWSDETFRIFGLDPEKDAPSFSEHKHIIHSEHWPNLEKAITKLSTDGTQFNIKFRILRSDGQTGWMHAIGRAEKDDAGNVLRMFGTAQDVTDHKKIEKKLRDSEERLHNAIEKSPFPVAFTDTNDDTIIYWSQSALKMFGHNPKKVSEWYELAYPDPAYRKQVINRWKPLLEKVLESNEAINTGEYQIVCKDGAVKVCEIYAHLIPGNLIVTLNDITERKVAEKAIVEQKQQAERYLNLAGVMFIGLDSNGNVNIANKKACDVLERDANEVIGKNWFDNFIPLEIRENVRDVFFQLMKDNDDPVEYYENPVMTKRGEERQIAWHNTAVKDDENNNIGILGSGEDITERMFLQKQLDHAHKMEAIGNLAGGIAHEFNNVLGIIIGNTELATDDLEEWHPVYENLREIKLASLRAKDVVKQLLSFSRKMDIKREPIDIRIIVKESLKLLRASIPSSIRIKENLSEDIDTVVADPTQIHQLLINLCNNAAQAMSEEGGSLTIELNNVVLDYKAASKHPDLKPGDYVRFSVSDTGHGIPLNMLDKIFDPYFTTKDIGKGTGMGLAVVHGIVKTHNGAINVDSTIGKGTEFHVYFPSSKDKVYHKKIEEVSLPRGKERILFVDDEVSIGKLCTQILEKLDYTVSSDADPEETLERFRSDPNAYDLVISDMTMPNLTGDRLAQELLKIRPDIPIVICTGFSEKISLEKAQKLGIKGLLMKPVEQADLAKTVRKVLDKAKG